MKTPGEESGTASVATSEYRFTLEWKRLPSGGYEGALRRSSPSLMRATRPGKPPPVMQSYEPEALRAPTKAELFHLATARRVELAGDDVIGPDELEDEGD